MLFFNLEVNRRRCFLLKCEIVVGRYGGSWSYRGGVRDIVLGREGGEEYFGNVFLKVGFWDLE